MTPKEIAESILNLEEYDDYLRDVELTYKVPELAKAYLSLESRLQKLVQAAKASQLRLQTLPWRLDNAADPIYTIIEREIWRDWLLTESTALDNVLRELDQHLEKGSG